MKKLLIIGKVWPESGSSAAGTRMLQLLRLFSAGGYQLSFASAAQKTPFSSDFTGLHIDTYAIAVNSETLDELLQQLKPEVVLFDRFMTEEQFGWRVAKNCPEAIRILDMEDLHCLREARRKALSENRKFEKTDLNNTVAYREIAAVLRCDLSLVISAYEMDLLRDHFQIAADKIWYIPFLYKALPSDFYRHLPAYAIRKDFVFVGNFLHPPNYDAVVYLKNKIWPGIHHQLPEARLYIYGAYSSAKVQQLHADKDHFLIQGRVEDLNSVLGRSRVLLAPLRFGAGLKGKFFDAMHSGTPAVTTAVGSEGIADEKKFPGAVQNRAEDMIRSTVALYTDVYLWEEAQKKGSTVINKHFNELDFIADFLDRLEDLRNRLQLYRANDFWQRLLTHHRLLSTRYLSKWIETKNQSVNNSQ